MSALVQVHREFLQHIVPKLPLITESYTEVPAIRLAHAPRAAHGRWCHHWGTQLALDQKRCARVPVLQLCTVLNCRNVTRLMTPVQLSQALASSLL